MKTFKKSFSPVIVLVFGLFINSNAQQLTPKSILIKSASVLTSRSSFSYEANYIVKYFDNADTTRNPGFTCNILKVPADTIISCYAHLYNANEEIVYDGTEFIHLWHQSKTGLRDIPAIHGKNITKNNIRKELIPSFFISDTPFSTYLEQGMNWKASEVILGKDKFWKIEFTLPVDDEITLLKRILFINKKTFLPVKLEGFAKFRDIQDEYFCLSLSNFSLTDTLKKTSFNPKVYLSNYAIDNYVPRSLTKTSLPNGSLFVSFEATDIDGKVSHFESSMTNDRLVLIDFWYLACAPCIEMMPVLSKLYDTYNLEGLNIFSLNPIDNRDEKLQTIKKLKAKVALSYPIFFTDKSILEKYQVNTFPTVYLIKKGKVIYSEVGYSENSIKVLKKIIEENLEN